MENTARKPWLTKTGNEISTEQLQEVSRVWDQDTWDQYLSWYSSKNRENESQFEADTQRPWLDSKGTPLKKSEFKKISKSWDQNTWDQFLNETVDHEFPENEVLSDDYNALVEETPFESDTRPRTFLRKVKDKVQRAVRRLYPVQRKVIVGLFYKNLTQVNLSRLLGISQQTVSEYKIISLSKIKKLLNLDPVSSSYLIGGHDNSKPQNQTQQEQIYEVYLADLKGSYIK